MQKAERGGRDDTPLFLQSDQTVEKHKCCLWFKAQTNRRGDSALCLLSGVQLERKAAQLKGCLKCYLFTVLR